MNCLYPTFSDVVQAVQNHQLDATKYVASCDNACIVMFGAGNPDVSGLGVMIAYIFQVAIVLLFGSILPILIWLLRSQSSPRIIAFQDSLRTLKKSVYTINAFYSNSLLIAAIVRFRQGPAVLETAFILRLVQVQIYIFLAMIASQLYDSYLNKAKISMLWLFFHTGIALAQVFLSFTISTPKATLSVCYDVAVACHKLRGTIDISYNFQHGTDSVSSLKWLAIGAGVGISAAILLAALYLYVPSVHKFFGKLARRAFPLWLQENGWSVFSMFLLIIWIPTLVLGTVTLFNSRNQMKKLGGEQFRDDEWGYGQTTAVLLWAPFLWEILTETFTFRKRASNTQPSTVIEELQQIPPPASRFFVDIESRTVSELGRNDTEERFCVDRAGNRVSSAPLTAKNLKS